MTETRRPSKCADEARAAVAARTAHLSMRERVKHHVLFNAALALLVRKAHP